MVDRATEAFDPLSSINPSIIPQPDIQIGCQ
jgi:hypothetical protein